MIKLNGKIVTEEELKAFLMALEPEDRKQVIKAIVQAIVQAGGATSLIITLDMISFH